MNDFSKLSYLVFVYGTLKGMRDGMLLGKAKTLAPFVMYDGGFPLVVPTVRLQAVADKFGTNPNKAGYIVGELYAIDDRRMRGLDSYEGAPSFYDKDKVEVDVFEWAMSTDDVDSLAFASPIEGVHLFPGGGSGTFTAWMYTGRDVLQSIPHRRQLTPSPEGTIEWGRM